MHEKTVQKNLEALCFGCMRSLVRQKVSECVCVCPKEFLNTVGILDPTLEVPLDHSSFHLCCPYSGEVLRIGSLQDCYCAWI